MTSTHPPVTFVRFGDRVRLPGIVSLFSGAGGLDLGFFNAGFPLAFAVDNFPAAVETHRHNFPRASALSADLIDLGPEGVVRHLDGILKPGQAIGVIGGPPCQGFSRANNASVATDPRNQLPMLYLGIVKALQARYDVQLVLFENVLGIRDAKHEVVFRAILRRLRRLGLHTRVDEYSALDFGVPQTRNRVIIAGFRERPAASAFAPRMIKRKGLTVRTAIEGLPAPAYYSRRLQTASIPHHPNHWTMQPISRRFSNPEELQSVGRSFRRLEWDLPSPTVAYGHREIHIHPDGHRRLSIFEAMLLQGFPASFILKGTLSAQVEQVSNAVPPPLAKALAIAAKRALRATASHQALSA
jgi:DNA (cytosine-5)-methyltransferase 1